MLTSNYNLQNMTYSKVVQLANLFLPFTLLLVPNFTSAWLSGPLTFPSSSPSPNFPSLHFLHFTSLPSLFLFFPLSHSVCFPTFYSSFLHPLFPIFHPFFLCTFLSCISYTAHHHQHSSAFIFYTVPPSPHPYFFFFFFSQTAQSQVKTNKQ